MVKVTWEIDFDETDADSFREQYGLQGHSDDEVFAIGALMWLQETRVGLLDSCNVFSVNGKLVDLGEVEL